GLGDPRYASGTIRTRMMRAEELIKQCESQMALIDELQHVVDRENKRVLQTVSDAIKNLIKLGHLACVLCGLQGEAEQVVDSNPQLARLFGDPVVLEPFTWDDSRPETVKEFRTLLEKVETILPIRDPSNLYKEEMAWRIFIATDGLMGYLMRLVRESTLMALDRGQESLDINLLAEVFDGQMAKARRGLQNPFLGKLPAYHSPSWRGKA
ncbi:MAG TPA: TniB family NTP-binding protein, partial [Anaerolineales bacterium]